MLSCTIRAIHIWLLCVKTETSIRYAILEIYINVKVTLQLLSSYYFFILHYNFPFFSFSDEELFFIQLDIKLIEIAILDLNF